MADKVYRFENEDEAIELSHSDNFGYFFTMTGLEGHDPERSMWGTSFTYDELVKFRDFINKVLDENKPK